MDIDKASKLIEIKVVPENSKSITREIICTNTDTKESFKVVIVTDSKKEAELFFYELNKVISKPTKPKRVVSKKIDLKPKSKNKKISKKIEKSIDPHSPFAVLEKLL